MQSHTGRSVVFSFHPAVDVEEDFQRKCVSVSLTNAPLILVVLMLATSLVKEYVTVWLQ